MAPCARRLPPLGSARQPSRSPSTSTSSARTCTIPRADRRRAKSAKASSSASDSSKRSRQLERGAAHVHAAWAHRRDLRAKAGRSRGDSLARARQTRPRWLDRQARGPLHPTRGTAESRWRRWSRLAPPRADAPSQPAPTRMPGTTRTTSAGKLARIAALIASVGRSVSDAIPIHAQARTPSSSATCPSSCARADDDHRDRRVGVLSDAVHARERRGVGSADGMHTSTEPRSNASWSR